LREKLFQEPVEDPDVFDPDEYLQELAVLG
jgi:hypothetical protein